MPCPNCGHALELLAMPDVCRALKVSPPTVYALIRAGKFAEPTKLGRSSRWLPEDVAAYIERLRQSSRALSAPPPCTFTRRIA